MSKYGHHNIVCHDTISVTPSEGISSNTIISPDTAFLPALTGTVAVITLLITFGSLYRPYQVGPLRLVNLYVMLHGNFPDLSTFHLDPPFLHSLCIP